MDDIPPATDPLQRSQLPMEVTSTDDIATDPLLTHIHSAIRRTGDIPEVPVPLQLTHIPADLERTGERAQVLRTAQLPTDVVQSGDVAQVDVAQPTTDVARPGSLDQAAQSLAAFPEEIARGEGIGSVSSLPRVARELLRLLELVRHIPLLLPR